MGDTWTDIDQGKLPNVVFYAAAYQTKPPYRLFVGGDVGVWALMPNGWLNISGNLPSAVVSDLVYHDKDRTLTAATYGRGIWRIKPANLAAPGVVASASQEQIELATGLRVDPTVSAPLQLAPADATTIDDPLRKTVVTVQTIPGALGYEVELAVQDTSVGFSSRTPEIAFQGFSEGATRWRVWAILPDGLRSPASPWRSIAYSH
jgi:hypothetical protein